jgi:hypothetical protein
MKTGSRTGFLEIRGRKETDSRFLGSGCPKTARDEAFYRVRLGIPDAGLTLKE